MTASSSPDAVPGEEFDYEALPPNYGLSHNMLAGAFAGIAEHTVMYPVDLMKTRMQIINPGAGGLYTGLSNAVSTIYRLEGLRTLWRGISSVIIGAGVLQAAGDVRFDNSDIATQVLHMRYISAHTRL
ncbi:Fe(2+) transporter [Elasticomyces elasticus]|uniref:Fe(2+) transporter n=1 Tax=Exophiala sideris TaxID=1016849 RepID=A0ABR0JFX9_9EURO|nr:Fe(2+) transporter [Elasticomyces elasticus]KAK5029192.1 Fe(2+) transporter [Exophiala sideris]KAK5063319.1 Fe(2+) transporter [Exophiala sideris]